MARDVLRTQALEALETGEFGAFGSALQREELPDVFALVIDPVVRPELAGRLGSDRVPDWIMSDETWNVLSYQPEIELTTAQTLLHLLWQDLYGRLKRKLEVAFQQLALASEGTVLCFFAGAELSVVVRYHRATGGGIDLRPAAVMDRPVGLFELAHLFDGATPEQRNALKSMAVSSDKLVYQRGVLVHVHRQRDDVCGPTIDTVVLMELVAQELPVIAATERAGITVVEIGPGNGMLSCLLSNSDLVSTLIAVDINPSAVSCTLKNLALNGSRLDSVRPEIGVRAERFRPEDLPAQAELVVCNPPYIPSPPGSPADGGSGYHVAVAGLELSVHLIESLERLVHPDGRLLLMTSSVSAADVLGAVPEGWRTVTCLSDVGLRVPLDVDVVWRSESWRNDLLRAGRIEVDAAGELWHNLQPVWIMRDGAG